MKAHEVAAIVDFVTAVHRIPVTGQTFDELQRAFRNTVEDRRYDAASVNGPWTFKCVAFAGHSKYNIMDGHGRCVGGVRYESLARRIVDALNDASVGVLDDLRRQLNDAREANAQLSEAVNEARKALGSADAGRDALAEQGVRFQKRLDTVTQALQVSEAAAHGLRELLRVRNAELDRRGEQFRAYTSEVNNVRKEVMDLLDAGRRPEQIAENIAEALQRLTEI